VISLVDYNNLIQNVDLDTNQAQCEAINYEGDEILMLVAGPGSGKTRVLVLRALRHVLVDGILPEQILITTFTRKAAKELRTRWLDWGTLLLDSLSKSPNLQGMIDRIDLNRCRIDTLDSIAQQALTENRLPGEVAPIVLEEVASKLILKRLSFQTIYYEYKDVLDELFTRYTFGGQRPFNQGEALSVAKTLCDRLIQDCVNLESIANNSPAYSHVVNILTEHHNQLRNANLFDFALLELKLLERLQDGTIGEWIDGIRILLIDEYQDTNPLQEAIYFEMMSTASPFVTIVGDDDQAMYRFRGGSVELFTQFGTRCEAATNRGTKRINMVENYRSSNEIVCFYNRHILSDSEFSSARILPSKPEVVSNQGNLGIPVLGLFRQNATALADALATWLDELLRNRRTSLGNGSELTLPIEGDLGDFVLLAHSIEEVKYNRYNRDAEPRFAGFFRNAMTERGRHVFNPRGMSLRTITTVQQLLGLVLLCLNPDGQHNDQIRPTNEANFFLRQWREAANHLVAQNPSPDDSGGILSYINKWQSESAGRHDDDFPNDWPVLELIFTLITWIPAFQNDPEHQVWLEAITRTVSSAGMASPYGMQIYQEGIHRERSRQSFIRDALLPIAENEVQVDEDIMPSVPRNYLQLMTIHQSKGLEFPLVIVDVGSQFTRNHPKQAFLRFPPEPSNVVRMEDDVEPHLDNPLRSYRRPIDRTFDDLARLYYVAYSRPQSALLLVGCENCLKYGKIGSSPDGAIPNIALGWNRNGDWPWRQHYTGRRRPIRVEPPMILI